MRGRAGGRRTGLVIHPDPGEPGRSRPDGHANPPRVGDRKLGMGETKERRVGVKTQRGEEALERRSAPKPRLPAAGKPETPELGRLARGEFARGTAHPRDRQMERNPGDRQDPQRGQGGLVRPVQFRGKIQAQALARGEMEARLGRRGLDVPHVVLHAVGRIALLEPDRDGVAAPFAPGAAQAEEPESEPAFKEALDKRTVLLIAA